MSVVTADSELTRTGKLLLGTIHGYSPATRRVEASLACPIHTEQRIEITQPPSGWEQSVAAIWHRGRQVKRAGPGEVVQFEVLRPVAAGFEIFALPVSRPPGPVRQSSGNELKEKRKRGGG